MTSAHHRPTRPAAPFVLAVVLCLAATGCRWLPWMPAAPTPAPATPTSPTSPTSTTTLPETPTTTSTTTTSTTTTSPVPSEPGPRPVPMTWCDTGTSPGPSAAPPGAVVVDPGSDPAAIARTAPAGTTFWLAPGTHAPSAAIDAQTGDVFVGAPGAVLDGGYRAIPAFTGGGTDVTIRNLTIQRFGTPEGHGWVNGAAVNRSVAARWTVVDNTIRSNDGNALFLGDGSETRRNCFADNGQTGLAAPAQRRAGAFVSITGIVVADNDVRGNNRNDLESAPGACSGCTGGMKLWQTTGAIVTGNTVAANHGVGIWLDNDNVDALVSGNVVAGNDREGIMVETSYNTRVVGNDVTGNAVVAGRLRNDSFPVAGIFVSNSGGSNRLAGTPGIEISGNRVADNWNGVVVYWDADRYCGSAGDTSVGHCTLGGATLDACAAAVERPTSVDALIDDCHWRSTGVSVRDNDFSMSPSLTAACAARCGRNGLVATVAPPTTRVRLADGTIRTVPNPLAADWARARVADPSANRFSSNRYDGVWAFDLRVAGSALPSDAWHTAGQDVDAV